MEAVGLAVQDRVEADLVITGEGSLDAQSLHGKTPAGVLRACELAAVPAVIVCGRAEIAPRRRARWSRWSSASVPTRRSRTPAPRWTLVAEELAGRADGARGGSATMSGAIDRFTEAARVLGLTPDVRRFPEGTKTAADAAAAIGCDVGQIVKSLVFMADDRPVWPSLSGANRVDEAEAGATVAAHEPSAGPRPRRRGRRPGSRWAARRRSAIRSALTAFVRSATCSRYGRDLGRGRNAGLGVPA